MRKTLMTIGAGPLQCPFIQMAKSLDLYVICTDGNKDAPGFA